MMKNKLLQNVCLLLMLGLLSGCAHCHKKELITRQAKGYGELCSYSTQYQLGSKLQNKGVELNYLGDHIFLVMPTLSLFPRHSVHFVSGAFGTLDTIAKFIKCYQKMSVRIVAYNDELTRIKANKSLAQLQAYQISNYLWRKGIDSRLIYAIGRVSSKEMKDPNKVEIYLRKLP